MPRPYRPLLVAAALTVALTACGGGSDEQPSAAEASVIPSPPASPIESAEGEGAGAAAGSVDAEDQTSDGTTITVSEVVLDGVEQGFIGVHMDLDGKPGPVVGVVEISQGTTTDLKVTFDEPVATGSFWPMLHVDDSEIGVYEFPATEGADLPVKDGETIVMKNVTLTVD